MLLVLISWGFLDWSLRGRVLQFFPLLKSESFLFPPYYKGSQFEAAKLCIQMMGMSHISRSTGACVLIHKKSENCIRMIVGQREIRIIMQNFECRFLEVLNYANPFLIDSRFESMFFSLEVSIATVPILLAVLPRVRESVHLIVWRWKSEILLVITWSPCWIWFLWLAPSDSHFLLCVRQNGMIMIYIVQRCILYRN